MRRTLILSALFALALCWNAAVIAAPAAFPPRLAAATYAAGALVCHQRSDRSFHLHGAQLPVCARCAGLYAGALVGIWAWATCSGWGRVMHARVRRWLVPARVRRALMLAALPTLVNLGLAWAGIAEGGNLLRGAAAVPLGAAIGALIAAVLAADLR